MIFVDCDGVTADLLSAVLERWNEEHDTALTVEDIKTFDLSTVFGSNKWFKQLQEKGFWANLPLMPKARELIETLETGGSAWSFLTSMPFLDLHPSAAYERAWWIDKNFGVDPKKHLIICSKKEYVVHAQGDFLVDDKPETAYDVTTAGGRVLVYKQPWNTEVAERGFERHSVEDLIRLFRGS